VWHAYLRVLRKKYTFEFGVSNKPKDVEFSPLSSSGPFLINLLRVLTQGIKGEVEGGSN